MQVFGLTLEGKNNKYYYIDLPEGTVWPINSVHINSIVSLIRLWKFI
jgi:hypothetical protein